jgi:hypothetical protein
MPRRESPPGRPKATAPPWGAAAEGGLGANEETVECAS